MIKYRPLPRHFYDRSTLTVAKNLLGKLLVHKVGKSILSGVIVETEAYTANDPACHASRGKTKRNAVMYGRPGHAYVYFIYGNHFCINAVTESHGIAGAVLIRALAPVDGVRSMQRRRRKSEVTHLANGPGKLCQALGIARAENGCDLTLGSLIIAAYDFGKFSMVKAPRIGISQATDWPWRFYVKGNKFVSRL
ncbi:MAG: DNA-3-methyladenine glycosylase [Candidatus Margulisbacteria bacterium]|nr:DNA-3-methyladenine glycosylase [Candidatus Margulisiibacteriota bacterium]MBU1021717.1 DNA-3-methyladenine glycosylase [Candidatus Margulisiibacteriota bacterium]MBU1729463.1 DNA-3-methyladenine glycosylase [Candidatus Margulisiibacteriota bacterium]MBU1955436.1 DNA-3-methyladenine glycosylase [Candidatus Margulisiibacteriota bacterium]